MFNDNDNDNDLFVHVFTIIKYMLYNKTVSHTPRGGLPYKKGGDARRTS